MELPHMHSHKIRELLDNAPDAGVFTDAAETFALISDPTRVRILWLLCHCEECVTNLAAAIEMSAPAVSHHLRILKQADILVASRIGKEVRYTLADNARARLVHRIVDDVFDMNCQK